MNFSFVNAEINNKLLNSRNPEIRDVGKTMQDMSKLMQTEIDALKRQIQELQNLSRR